MQVQREKRYGRTMRHLHSNDKIRKKTRLEVEAADHLAEDQGENEVKGEGQ